jgi:hypothetical protein
MKFWTKRFAAAALLLSLPFAGAGAAVPSDAMACRTNCSQDATKSGLVRLAASSAAFAVPRFNSALSSHQNTPLVRVQATTDVDAKPPPNWKPTPEVVMEVQQTLSELGYDPGPTDGLMGSSTARAIRKFEKERNLKETGQITFALVKRLEGETKAQEGEASAAATESEQPASETETDITITEDPATYDLGNLSELNDFD